MARSLGGGRGQMLTCVSCDRWLPRDAIAFIGRKKMLGGKHKGKPRAVCGECYRSGGRWWGPSD